MKNPFSAKNTREDAIELSDSPSIQGYIENIDNFQIEGWAISHENTAINLAIQIGKTKYPLSANWFERTDIADQFGA